VLHSRIVAVSGNARRNRNAPPWGLLEDLAKTPKRKPSAKRTRHDRDIFRQARDAHHRRMVERAAQTDEDRELTKSVDWGIDLD
jgi:hypothetical protein